jgi:hypothetical protein
MKAKQSKNRSGKKLRQSQGLWRPFDQTITTTFVTTAATANSVFPVNISTALTDLSGAAVSRRAILRRVRIVLAPFDLVGSTTVPSPQLNGQLAFRNLTIATRVPMTQVRPFNNTRSTVFEFRVPRDFSQVTTSNAAVEAFAFLVNNPLGATALAYTLYPVITTWWDLAEDSVAD